jgi:hypothetical protein
VKHLELSGFEVDEDARCSGGARRGSRTGRLDLALGCLQLDPARMSFFAASFVAVRPFAASSSASAARTAAARRFRFGFWITPWK